MHDVTECVNNELIAEKRPHCLPSLCIAGVPVEVWRSLPAFICVGMRLIILYCDDDSVALHLQ